MTINEPPRFVAVGHRGVRLTSRDGASWAVAGVGKEGEVYRAAASGGGRFAAIGTYGGDNLFGATADGVAWSGSRRDAHYSAYLRGLAFGGGRFVAIGGDPGTVGAGSPIAATSPDGESWADPAPIAGKFVLRRLAFGDGRFVAVGDRGRRATSPDGLTWHDAPEPRAVDTLIDVAFGGGRFVGVGLHGLRMSTEDGLTWSAPTRGVEGEHLNSVLWADGRFVAVGLGATYLSTDGRDWKRHVNTNAPHSAVYGSGVFVGVRWRGKLLRSADGIDWKIAHTGEHHVEAVAAA